MTPNFLQLCKWELWHGAIANDGAAANSNSTKMYGATAEMSPDVAQNVVNSITGTIKFGAPMFNKGDAEVGGGCTSPMNPVHPQLETTRLRFHPPLLNRSSENPVSILKPFPFNRYSYRPLPRGLRQAVPPDCAGHHPRHRRHLGPDQNLPERRGGKGWHLSSRYITRQSDRHQFNVQASMSCNYSDTLRE